MDPFNAKNNTGVKETEATSYKEVMLDVQLEKERKEILFKIEEKKKAEKVKKFISRFFLIICRKRKKKKTEGD
jgi:hypothetical protein